jgi:hypothetical protein
MFRLLSWEPDLKRVLATEYTINQLKGIFLMTLRRVPILVTFLQTDERNPFV